MNIYKTTEKQIYELINECYKIHSIGIILEIDRIASKDSDIIEEWENQPISNVISNIARIIQDLADGVIDDLNKIMYPGPKEKEDSDGI